MKSEDTFKFCFITICITIVICFGFHECTNCIKNGTTKNIVRKTNTEKGISGIFVVEDKSLPESNVLVLRNVKTGKLTVYKVGEYSYNHYSLGDTIRI